jgi:hypothetical protein
VNALVIRRTTVSPWLAWLKRGDRFFTAHGCFVLFHSFSSRVTSMWLKPYTESSESQTKKRAIIDVYLLPLITSIWSFPNKPWRLTMPQINKFNFGQVWVSPGPCGDFLHPVEITIGMLLIISSQITLYIWLLRCDHFTPDSAAKLSNVSLQKLMIYFWKTKKS